MRIVVLGSTGGTGQQLVTQALRSGHDVTSVVRKPEAVTTDHPNLRIRRGDVLDPASLDGAFDHAEAVLSALGSHSGRQPTYVYSRGMQNIRAAMVRAGVRRVVAISAIPISRSEEKSFVDRYIAYPLLKRFFGGSYDDLRRMEVDLRAATDVDWTVLRPPRLLNRPATGSYRMAVEAQLPGARDITRADLAAAMLAVLEDRTLFHRVVIVAR